VAIGQRLTPAERVRRRPEFERAYNTGVRIHGRFMTVFAVANGTERPRFGVAATRKLGAAVIRNRAKRLARELFRRHKVAAVGGTNAGLDIIIVPRREMLDASFANVESDFLAVLERRGRERQRPAAPRGSRPRTRADSRV
jgi:ribonuclease P protein component